MSNRKQHKISGDQILPLRVPEEMRLKVRELSTKAGLSDADIMRLAITRGLDRVEKMFEIAERKAA